MEAVLFVILLTVYFGQLCTDCLVFWVTVFGCQSTEQVQRYKRGKLGLPTSKSYSTRHDRPIHGKGLFARKHIGAGELIGILDGVPTSTCGEHVLWLGEEMEFTFGMTLGN